jgi:hypothetical protein
MGEWEGLSILNTDMRQVIHTHPCTSTHIQHVHCVWLKRLRLGRQSLKFCIVVKCPALRVCVARPEPLHRDAHPCTPMHIRAHPCTSATHTRTHIYTHMCVCMCIREYWHLRVYPHIYTSIVCIHACMRAQC